MDEIGLDFKTMRTSSSISIEEASSDTNIPTEALEQIEDGAIGSFKDIFKLKSYLEIYAKYLGLDPNQIIDQFNEYMFEYTSKIPLDDLEREIETKAKIERLEDTNDIKVVSPYLKPTEPNKSVLKYVIITIVIIVLIAAIMIWAIRQVTM